MCITSVWIALKSKVIISAFHDRFVSPFPPLSDYRYINKWISISIHLFCCYLFLKLAHVALNNNHTFIITKILPGGPMAAMSWMSINLMGVTSFRSYQVQWSNHCLSNSIGGWAPNCSLIGMFKSSTKTI